MASKSIRPEKKEIWVIGRDALSYFSRSRDTCNRKRDTFHFSEGLKKELRRISKNAHTLYKKKQGEYTYLEARIF